MDCLRIQTSSGAIEEWVGNVFEINRIVLDVLAVVRNFTGTEWAEAVVIHG